MSETNSGRVRLELEYPIRSSLNILFQHISTPSGLESWFADHVSVQSGTYTFEWNDGTKAVCVLEKSVSNKFMRFKVVDSPEDEYLEIRIIPDELSGENVLQITEFTSEEEAEELADIWDSAVDTLCSRIGA